MKFAHLSDLHIGKYVNGFSMLEEQKYILAQIMEHLLAEQVKIVCIAGDIYDVSVPSAEAISVFDKFLTQLAKHQMQAYIISGNHDSAERLAYGTKLLAKSGIYLAPPFDGTIAPWQLQDEFGTVNIYLLSFLKPVIARHFWPDEKIDSYDAAVRVAVKKMQVDERQRNILLAHQFVTGAAAGGSENIIVGGIDNVGADAFAPFDYVALGHIHRAQVIGQDERLRYCGTPLQYSFSEVNDVKGLTIVELQEKGKLTVKSLPLQPLHRLREITGSYQELVAKENYAQAQNEDYLSIVLTDEHEILDAMEKLRTIYPQIMRLRYAKQQERDQLLDEWQDLQELNPLEMLQDFYRFRNGRALEQQQKEYLKQAIERIFGAEKCDH